MDQADAFLQAIADDPADDAARLIYADWLDEQPDEASRARADFIRVQYALRDLGPDDPRRVGLEECQRDFLLAHAECWTAPLRALGVADCRFRRGFVERVAVMPEALARAGREICALAPVRELALLPPGRGARHPSVADTTRRLAEADWLGRIHSLDLIGVPGNLMDLRALLFSPRLSHLSSLAIPRTPRLCNSVARAPFAGRLRSLTLFAGDANTSAAELLGSGTLESLTRLELRGPGITLDELEAFAAAVPPALEELALTGLRLTAAQRLAPIALKRIATLRKLELNGNALTVEMARVLAQAPLLDSVEELDLGSNSLGDQGVGFLARSPYLTRLGRLSLNSNRLGPDACRALAVAEVPHLRSLNVRTNTIGDEGLTDLARGPSLAALTALHASYNRVSSRGALWLAEAFPAFLSVLDLSWNPIGDAGVRALASATQAPHLTALDLSYCELGDDAVVALAGSPTFAELRTLNLGSNHVGDAALAALAGSPCLGRLSALNLGYSRVGDAGVRALLESPLLHRLTALHLSGSSVTAEQRQRLAHELRGILG
jgi:uncharacterized protein (TIGR02996 family)